MYEELFKDRIEAGLLLSEKLKKYRNTNSLVLAIPRGGVPIGYEVAKNLNLPLDVILSKKIGHPSNKEFAIGAISKDSVIFNGYPGVSQDYIESEIIRLRKSLQEKDQLYRGNIAEYDYEGKNLIVVDDGIATGNTLLACIGMLRNKNPAKIVVAVPVVPNDRLEEFQQNTDEFIYVMAPEYFRSVGAFYEQFKQVEDEEVIQMLRAANLSE